MPPAVIAGVGAVAAGVGGAISASKQAKAAKQAAQVTADTSIEVADKNNALAREIYAKNEATLAPWQKLGMDAVPGVNAMMDLLPGGPGENMGFDAYKRSTGYNERMKAGLDAVRGGFSGMGALKSGASLKALARYGQDYASNEFGNYVNSLMPRLNAMTGTRDLGFNAAGAQTGVATNYSGQVMGNNNMAAAGVIDAARYRAQNSTSPFGNALGMMGGVLSRYQG